MATLILQPNTSVRQNQIIKQYLKVLDNHIEELRNGASEKTLEIRDFASMLNIHPRHLSNTIQEVLGKSPCDIYEHKLVEVAKDLLLATDKSIAEIAHQLTFDPSNFTKFFKRFAGTTPKEFRRSWLSSGV